MVEIVKKQIARNFTDGHFAKKYIVVHETDNWAAGADAMAHFNYYNTTPNQVSTTFVVDDKIAVQMMDLDDRSWAVGVIYGDPRNVTDADNANTINIEICVNSDGDYMRARQNCIELVKYLMKETGIPADRVIRHYDACLKWCPRKMMDNPALWADFKAQLVGQSPVVVPAPQPSPVINNAVRDLQNVLNRLGFRGADGRQLAVDGDKGPNTDFAVRSFQGVVGLSQDAIAGSMTMGAVNQILSKPLVDINHKSTKYAVRYIQYRVGAGIDGDFGPNTRNKVIAWQRSVGLSADGCVGPMSWGKLVG